MNNDIKEILNNLIRYRNEDNKWQPEDILTIEDVWLLLDYITNLQEELEEEKRIEEKSLETINNLQEENEILKIEKQEEYNRFNLMSKFRDKALARELMYKSRIDKAIEYIWSKKYEYGDLEEDNEDFDIDVYKLLNILNGDDKE